MVTDAIQKADQTSIKARLDAIAVKDPARALALLDQNRSMAGVTYDNLANSYRSRAQLQTGNAKAKIPGFVAVDRYTLQIKLRQPYPQLIWVLTMPYAFVIPREAVAHYGAEFRRHPVGSRLSRNAD